MKDSDILKRFEELEKRLSVIEGTDKNPEELFLTITLPEAEIDGLYFNKMIVKSVFELKDGVYYSKDILFHSARNTEDDSSRDILTEYLESDEVKQAFAKAYNKAAEDYNTNANIRINYNIDTDDIEVFLPEENQGAKKHNGARECYWLKKEYNATYFVFVNNIGHAYYSNANYSYGVSPAFRIVEDNA